MLPHRGLVDVMTALGAGVLAGLALAVPVGAIGVLLVQEGATRGLRTAAAAASAVATVDVLYCLTAVCAGSALAPVITSWGAWPRRVGGVLLVAIAVTSAALASSPAGATDAQSPQETSQARGIQRYVLFLTLTAVNPATLIYFAALVAALPAVTTSGSTAVLFTLGVGLASLMWQLFLASLGAALRWKTGARFTRATTLIGHVTMALFGILLLTGITLP